MPVVVQRQVSTAQTVQKAMEGPLLQSIDKVSEHPRCGAETDFPNGPDCSEDH